MALRRGEEDATPNPNPSEKTKTTTTKQQWRFTWETLAHTPTLRLYLFRPPGSTDPLSRCSDLRASLCLVESLLLVSFLDLEAPAPALAALAAAAVEARQVVLRVPVPRVLIDPGCPVECVAKSDHIEIKLALIVPVDHPLIKEFRGALDSDRDVMGSWHHDQAPLSMNDDLKSISSGGVDFYCNTCSTKLTKQPLRNHTLERVFVNLLLQSVEDEISFRTVVRDVQSKDPMLQLVLLSSKAWYSTGHCFENDANRPLCAAELQPVVKLLFSDCSTTASEDDSRLVEEWSRRNHAEEVYMLRYQIEELIQSLISAVNKLPPSCSSLHGMHLSWLER